MIKKMSENDKKDSIKDIHKIAIRKVQWALQEAYPIAVHNAGITDWSQENNLRKRQIEIDQKDIASMILKELNIEEKRFRFLRTKKVIRD